MSLSGLQLTGSLSVSKSATSDVGTDMENTLNLQDVQTDRPTSTTSGTAVYYVKVTANINGSITLHSSDSDSNEDDAWEMSALSFSSADDSNYSSPTLKFPSASNVDVDAGLITGTADSGSGTFPVTLTVSASDQGVLSSSIAISGDSFTGSNDEDLTKAQLAYWPINDGSNDYSSSGPDALGETDPDTLSAALTASALSTHYASTLSSINDQYDSVNLIQSWSISVSAVAQASNSNLSNHARTLGRTDANVFGAGDKIVAATPFSYSISINDYQSNATTVVSASDVYGVVEQSA